MGMVCVLAWGLVKRDVHDWMGTLVIVASPLCRHILHSCRLQERVYMQCGALIIVVPWDLRR